MQTLRRPGNGNHLSYLLKAGRQKAGVLQLTLGIALVVSVVCASFILIAYYQRLATLRESTQARLDENIRSALAYAMAHRVTLPYGDVITLDLFGEQRDSVRLCRKPWGLFDHVSVEAWQRNMTRQRSVLLAAQPDTVTTSALYIPFSNAPTYLVGNARLIGDVYVPRAGITTASVDGVSFERKKLVEGKTKVSQDWPPVDSALLRPIFRTVRFGEPYHQTNETDMQSGQHTPQDDQIYTGSMVITDSLKSSCVIRSFEKITLQSNSWVNHAIIFAKDIEVEEGFSGSVQLIATRHIKIGPRARLLYPSALVLVGGQQDSLIELRDHAYLEGAIFVPGYDKQTASQGIVKLHKGAVFHGMAFINGPVQVDGAVWGNLTIRGFRLDINGAIYGNYFRDGEVNSLKRAAAMPASLMWGFEGVKPTIAKWLD